MSGQAEAEAASTPEMLRREIEALRDEIRIRRKYGSQPSSEEIAQIAADEKRQAQRKKEREAAEAARLVNEAKRHAEIRAGAREMVSSGRILASVEGVRAQAVGEDLLLACSHCGAPLPGSGDMIFDYAARWLDTPADQRFGQYSRVLLNPHVMSAGAPLYHSAITCPACRGTSKIAVMLVVL